MLKPARTAKTQKAHVSAKKVKLSHAVDAPQDVRVKKAMHTARADVPTNSPTPTKALSPSKEKLKKNASKKVAKSLPPTSFKVIAGSYEKLLYGLEGTFVGKDGEPSHIPTLKAIFIFPAHVSCVKAVTASPNGGKWLATGSADEIVKVWDLRRRKEIGGLMQHEGSITHLSFPSRSHLLSASEDGTICLFHARDWVVLRTLKGHKGRVNSVAVHPSGKVGLSVGKDRTLRMWDLMRGKGSASTKLGKEGETVRWSATGHRFIVQSQSTIDVYSTEMTLLHTLTHPSRLHDVRFCQRVDGDGELLLAAGEDKKVTIYSIESGTNTTLPVVGALVGHTNRVKAVDALEVALPPSESGRRTTTILSTVSSDGKIRIFDLAALPPASSDTRMTEIQPVAEYDTKGTRLTCCALADGEASMDEPTVAKRKRGDAEGENGDADSGSDVDEGVMMSLEVDAESDEEEVDEDDT